jgi:hypothetical protein
MKKNRFAFSILSILIFINLTGCGNIKFIEKVSESTVELGEISEDSSLGEIVSAEDPESSMSTEENTESVDNSNIIVIENIEFIKEEKEIQIFLNDDAKLHSLPSVESDVIENLLKGEPLNLIALDKDNNWVMVKHFNGPISYIEYKYMSYSYVRPDNIVVTPTPEVTPEVTPTPEPTSEPTPTPETTKKPTPTQKPESTPKPTPTPKPESTPKPTPTPKPESTPTPTPTPEPTPTPTPTPKPTHNAGYYTDGIPYPDNPISTSINLGITFADVDIILTVTIDKTTANSGPGKATTSTGYEVRYTFNKGDTVACTGIGENGYCRIELANGSIAFIDGKCLKE